MLEPVPARAAAPAEDERHDPDAISGSDVADAGTHGDHLAGELVPEDLRRTRAGERVRNDRNRARPARILVQVGATDPTAARRDEHLAVGRLTRRENSLDANVASPVEARRPQSRRPV